MGRLGKQQAGQNASKQITSSDSVFLNAILNTIDNLVIVLDQQGSIVHFNRACEKLSGYTAEQVMGKAIWDLLIPQDEQETIRRVFNDLSSIKFPNRYNNHWKTSANELRFIEWSNTAILDTSGMVTHVVATGVDITELYRSRERSLMYQRIMSAASGLLSFVDTEYIYRAVNDSYLRAQNMQYDDIVGHSVAELFGQEVFESIKPRLDRCLSGETLNYQAWFDFKALGRRLMDVRYSPAKEHDGSIGGIVVNAHDISDQDAADRERRMAAKVFQKAGDGILITDSKGIIVDVNPAFCAISGFDREDVIGQKPSVGKSGIHDSEFYKNMWRQLVETGRWEGEIWDRRKNGELYPKWLNITAVTDSAGQVDQYVGMFTDISEQKALQDKLRHLAHHDPLTGLPNRSLFYDRLAQTVVQARRSQSQAAVLYIDLDHFKQVNDNYGHDTGDELLCAVTERLLACIRESDTLARIGGDEFTVILNNIKDVDTATGVAEKMIGILQTPMELGQHILLCQCSIGICVYPNSHDTVDGLIKCADNALYKAKNSGRNTYIVSNHICERGSRH